MGGFEVAFFSLGVFAIGCTRSANGKGSIALNPFDRAGTTVKRVFLFGVFHESTDCNEC